MEFEAYKKRLARRIEQEVVHGVIVPTLFEGHQGAPPSHPLIPMFDEELLREEARYSREAAKRRVLEALDYIYENKKAMEKEMEKGLKPPAAVVTNPSPELEDQYIEMLKGWAKEKAEEMRRRQHISVQAAQQKEREYEQKLRISRDEILRKLMQSGIAYQLGPLVFLLPTPVLYLIHKHGLHEDPEVAFALRQLQEELRKPPPFFRGEWWVENMPEWFLRLLHKSKEQQRM